jgi:hypothetical protein
VADRKATVGWSGVAEIRAGGNLEGLVSRVEIVGESCLQQRCKQSVTEAVDQTDNDLPAAEWPEEA